MPFIPLVAAGVGVVGSVLSNKGKNKNQASTSTTTLDPALQTQVNKQNDISNFSLNAGKPLIDMASNSYGTALDFYKKIISGSDEDIMKLFNAGDYTKSADESQAQASEIWGRSGPRAAVLGQTTEDRAAAINKIIQQLRASAPQNIANIGQAAGNTGTNLISAAEGASTSASNVLFGEKQLDVQTKQAADDRRAQIISSIIGTAGSVAGVVAASKTK